MSCSPPQPVHHQPVTEAPPSLNCEVSRPVCQSTGLNPLIPPLQIPSSHPSVALGNASHSQGTTGASHPPASGGAVSLFIAPAALSAEMDVALPSHQGGSATVLASPLRGDRAGGSSSDGLFGDSSPTVVSLVSLPSAAPAPTCLSASTGIALTTHQGIGGEASSMRPAPPPPVTQPPASAWLKRNLMSQQQPAMPFCVKEMVRVRVWPGPEPPYTQKTLLLNYDPTSFPAHWDLLSTFKPMHNNP